MLIREVYNEERSAYDAVVNHPLQSWAWGEARRATGVGVVRLGMFNGKNLIKGWQLTVHPIPKLGRSILYCPRGAMPDEEFTLAVADIANKYKAVFLKCEPDVWDVKSQDHKITESQNQLVDLGYIKGRNLFTEYNFLIDLSLSEEDLMARMKSKTRYNVRLAQKKGVVVMEDNSSEAFEKYLELQAETVNRQQFYAHTADYHRKVWGNMYQGGVAHLIVAKYEGRILSTWVLFKWKDRLYYPYGASSREHREVMANNLMMWEVMRWGKQKGCKVFDLWGTAGLNPDPGDDWYGFHKFKEGYGPEGVQYVGAYDYVLDSVMYKVVTNLDVVRRWLLKLKAGVVGGKF